MYFAGVNEMLPYSPENDKLLMKVDYITIEGLLNEYDCIVVDGDGHKLNTTRIE